MMRMISIGSSLVSLGLATADYTDHKLKYHCWREEPNFLGNLLILLWRLPALSARCISIAVFAVFVRDSEDKTYFLLTTVFLLHFIYATVLEFHHLNTEFLSHWLAKGKCHLCDVVKTYMPCVRSLSIWCPGQNTNLLLKITNTLFLLM